MKRKKNKKKRIQSKSLGKYNYFLHTCTRISKGTRLWRATVPICRESRGTEMLHFRSSTRGETIMAQHEIHTSPKLLHVFRSPSEVQLLRNLSAVDNPCTDEQNWDQSLG